MYYSDQQPYQQHGRMIQPSNTQQSTKKPSVTRKVTASNNYSNLYERALQAKVKQAMFKSQQQQYQTNLTQHTPSSISISSNISTLELIQYVLREYEHENPMTMHTPTAAKSSYTIYEDLKIIFSLSQENNISASSFKRLSDEGIVIRTPDSIRSRYQDFLKNLTKDDYQNILSYIESNQLKGFLVFEKNNDNIRMLHAISKTDPRLFQFENNNINNNKISTPLLSSPVIPNNNDQDQSRSRSPMFPPNLYETGPYQQYTSFPPQYPMFPPSMYPPHMQQSPLRQHQSPNQQFYDNGIQQQYYSQQMQMNPYQMNQYGMYPPIQYQSQIGNDEEQGGSEQVYQVRPSAKKSNIPSREIDEEKEELEQLITNFQKKRKFNESSNKSNNNNALNNSKKQQQSNEKSKQQPQQQQKNIQKQERNNNLRLSRNPAKFSSHNPAQPSMILHKQQQQQQSQLQGQRSSSNNTKASSQSQRDKVLMKEVYELISDEDRIPESQFNEIIGYVSQQVKLPKEKVIDFLDQLSGSFKDLNTFLEKNQENMLWTKEEDEILEGLKSMDTSEYKLLMKLKGVSSIKKRIIYNSLKLPFIVV